MELRVEGGTIRVEGAAQVRVKGRPGRFDVETAEGGVDVSWTGALIEASVEPAEGGVMVSWQEGPAPTPPPPPVGDPLQVEVAAFRVTVIEPPENDITGLEIVSQPQHGYAVVQPDDTLALVLTGTDHTGALSFVYEATTAEATIQRVVECNAVQIGQDSGWGLGRHYVLPVDEDDRTVVEPGSNHRKVYVAAEGGLTRAAIAADAGVSEATVTNNWLRTTGTGYGTTEGGAFAQDVGISLWHHLLEQGPSSHWLLLERGGTYAGTGSIIQPRRHGESPLHPLLVTAWGEGDRPYVVDDLNNANADHRNHNIVVRGLRMNRIRLRDLSGVTVHRCHLFEDILTEHVQGVTFQSGGEYITVRYCALMRAYDDDTGHMNASYTNGIRHLLFHRCLLHHANWHPDFMTDLEVRKWDAYGHNAYHSFGNRGETASECVSVCAGSYGYQWRGGVVSLGCVSINNGIGVLVLGGPNGSSGSSTGNFGNDSAVLDLLITRAHLLPKREGDSSNYGANNWGMGDMSAKPLIASYAHCLVVNGENPAQSGGGRNALSSIPGADNTEFWYSDIKVFDWQLRGTAGVTTYLTDGLDAETLGDLNIDSFAATLPNEGVPVYAHPQVTPEMQAYVEHAESLAGQPVFGDLVTATLNYFRAGFDLPLLRQRTTPATLRFVPGGPVMDAAHQVTGVFGSLRGATDGRRWDVRLHWWMPDDSAADGPPIDGDTLHLQGSRVVTYATWAGTVELQGGRLQIFGGRIGGTIEGPGEVWLDDPVGQCSATVDGADVRLVHGMAGAWTGALTNGARLLAADGSVLDEAGE